MSSSLVSYWATTPLEVRLELIHREKRRRNFRAFVSHVYPRFKWYRHCRVLADVLQRVADGEIKRLMIFMPPRHGKSLLTSRLFTAYWLYRYPDQWVGVNSYGADLAFTLSRSAREHFVAAGGVLSRESTAVNHWETSSGGGLWAAGVGGPIAGKGFNLGIIDDPLKNAEDAASEVVREKQKEWYSSTFYTREEPNSDGDPDGAIVIIQCMTGDTPVLLADGTEKPLRAVRVGDAVATYDRGRLSASKVLNWKSQGSDYIFTIRMSSGITVRANKRHPFLVERGGNTEWIRLKDLKVGDRVLRAIGESGAASPARTTDATSLPSVKAIARRITARPGGRTDTGRRRSIPNPEERRTCGTDTVSTSRNTIPSSKLRAGSVRSAESPRLPTCVRIGAASSALTMTTRRGRPAACFATTAISRSRTGRRKRRYSGPLDTFEITPDRIVEIAEAGREEVFDIQVEGTENFVANSLISHNTRWHEDDLSGWILSEEGGDDGSEGWHVVCLDAIHEKQPPEFPPTCTVEPDWRKPGEALCPERRPLSKLERIRRAIASYFWGALFQQRPMPRTGGMFPAAWPIVEAIPVCCTFVRYWDKAGTAGGGAYTAGVKMARAVDQSYYITHVERGQWSAGEREAVIKSTAAMDGKGVAVWVEQEGGSGGKESAENTVIMLAGYAVHKDPVSGSKPTRAEPLAAQAEVGNVRLLKGEWNRDFVDEARLFPHGKYLDQIDAAAGAFNKLALAPAPRRLVAAGNPLAGYRG